MGVHEHFEKQRGSELGGYFKGYPRENLEYVEVIQGQGFCPKKIKTRRDKKIKHDESVVIVFHNVSTSEDVHLTMRQAKQRLAHYKQSGKATGQIELGLSQAKGMRFRRC